MCSSDLTGASGAGGLSLQGVFRLRTLDEVPTLARALAARCPNADGALLVLQELLINAIEHGNLAIDYASKTALVLAGQWHDEVLRRLEDPVLGAREVVVELLRTAERVSVTITDQGAGFDWKEYLELSPERAFDPNGRGIFLARTSGVHQLTYAGAGNVVTATWRLDD